MPVYKVMSLPLKSQAYSGQDQDWAVLLERWIFSEARVVEANRRNTGTIILNKELNHAHWSENASEYEWKIVTLILNSKMLTVQGEVGNLARNGSEVVNRSWLVTDPAHLLGYFILSNLSYLTRFAQIAKNTRFQCERYVTQILWGAAHILCNTEK